MSAVFILSNILDDIVRERHPEGRALQAQGQWFHLLALAEQYEAAPDASGTFERVIKEAKERGVSREFVESCVTALHIVPVITAHPNATKSIYCG